MTNTLRYLKALADETRLRLALVLQHYELSVNELVTLMDMGQSRISRHLKILAEAGLVQSRRDGLWVFYSVPEQGQGHDFLESVLSYSKKDSVSQADLGMASHILEERARKTRQFFNAIAEDWDELNREVLGTFHLADAVKDSVPEQCGTAVDLGCGTGEVVETLRTVCREVIGVDGSSRMLELARRRFGENAPDVSLRIGELDHLPLRDGEAEFACINLVLHHLSHPETALKEISRVLQAGGTLLVADFDRHQVEDMRTVYKDRWLGFTRDELEDMLANVGLKAVRHQSQSVNLGLSLHLILAQKSS